MLKLLQPGQSPGYFIMVKKAETLENSNIGPKEQSGDIRSILQIRFDGGLGKR